MNKWNKQRAGVLILCIATAGFVFHDNINGRATALEKSSPANPQDLALLEKMSEAFRQVAKNVRPAVVQIKASNMRKPPQRSTRRNIDPRDLPEPFQHFFEDFGRGQGPGGEFQMPVPPPQKQESTGSGVIIDAQNGYILTNNHVIGEGKEEDRRIDVTLADGRRIARAKVLGTDPNTDLALLQIKADKLHALPLGDSDAMEVGDWVLAIGAPFGLEQTVTQGIISATGRDDLNITQIGELIQTDAAINPGNSGGPLVNMHGEVIGVNTAIATSGTVAGYMGVGFAIPSKLVMDIIPSLREGKDVIRGYLGVRIRGSNKFEPGLAESYGLKEEGGVLIEDFYRGVEDSPARKAGLKIDDIILSFNDTPVRTAPELQRLVSRTPPDTTVNLRIWRDGKEITVPVTIEKQPKHFYSRDDRSLDGDEEEGGDEEASEANIEDLGITVEPLDDATAKRYDWKDDADAKNRLVVTEVEPLGEGAALGISPGDLIISVQSEEIESVDELRNALSKEALARGVRLRVKSPRAGFRMLFLQITPSSLR